MYLNFSKVVLLLFRFNCSVSSHIEFKKGKIEKMEEKELIIARKFTNMYYYAYNLFEKYPKSERFGLVADMKNCLNNGLRYIFYAQKVSDSKKLDYLNKLDAELLYLRFAVRLSDSKNYISHNNYMHFSSLINEIGKMLGGWIKSCPKG